MCSRLCGGLNDTWVTQMGSEIISKESWHLPTLVAGVMHNIEPAHHALQQGGGVNREEKRSRKLITSVIKSDIDLTRERTNCAPNMLICGSDASADCGSPLYNHSFAAQPSCCSHTHTYSTGSICTSGKASGSARPAPVYSLFVWWSAGQINSLTAVCTVVVWKWPVFRLLKSVLQWPDSPVVWDMWGSEYPNRSQRGIDGRLFLGCQTRIWDTV